MSKHKTNCRRDRGKNDEVSRIHHQKRQDKKQFSLRIWKVREIVGHKGH